MSHWGPSGSVLCRQQEGCLTVQVAVDAPCTGSAVTALVLLLLHANPLQETLYSCSQMHGATGATSKRSAGLSLICNSERICNAACSTSLHLCIVVAWSCSQATPLHPLDPIAG